MFGAACGSSVVSLAENVEGGQHVEDEDRRPAEEEEKHDEDLKSLLITQLRVISGPTEPTNIYITCLVSFSRMTTLSYGDT